MPILKVPDDNAPLSQGDVLKGINLLVTGDDWNEKGGSVHQKGEALCLVLSRPCVVEHKRVIVVAAIGQAAEPGNSANSFEQVREFLEDLRDGTSAPDRFYLGQIPNEPAGRYAVHLDSLHTVTVPTDKALIRESRIATLSDDFVRDLHLRVFRSFASLGFDDASWFANEDLEWLLKAGESDLASKKSELASAESKLAGLKSKGSVNPKELGNREREITNLKANVEDMVQRIEPYQNELEKRRS